MDAAENRAARAALASCAWFNELVASGSAEELEGLSEAIGETHYVIGKAAPIRMRFAVTYPSSEGGKMSMVVAIYFGRFSDNTLGMAHGGAVASCIDFITAISASATAGLAKASLTKSLEVRYLSKTPLGQVVRLDTDGEYLGNGEALISAEISDPVTNSPCARGKAILVDLERRAAEKAKL
ncbi:Hypothetical Protein FCC1311_050412 [Hondaea fermentalgiana]|uniref:Thioesterase domain-containing protein n=1 Tax=Hondaea fermentalgiana TaxID=2315210 RepID=A0A2R5GCW8_9STRA|nr:Hypothetical Protein FCC1311_050412 [Hondaea fermentalgiana]|eukprot:GBG28820.1 Hypothetical Protein FCC1311_050412 [Hondaea fermentalgiana]